LLQITNDASVIPLITLYGSTESELPIAQDRSRALPRGSGGRLRPGRQMRIRDDHGEEVPTGTPGNLLLRSDKSNSFFRGYFHDPASTAASFAGLWLNTGDLAKVDEEGNVYFVGRVKDVVRRRGENINASEVEEEFLQHPDILIAAAYGVPSRLCVGTEEDIKVAVQLRLGSALDEKAIWEWSAGRMARFQVPRIVQIVNGIGRTSMGKIEKGSLSGEGVVEFDIRQYKVAAA
jgi:acyl-coenzyme A synthetase/AMP-(fatty) acid ligase